MKNIIRKVKSFASRNEAIILNYHSICANKLPFSIAQHLPVKEFELQLQHIRKHFNCIPLHDLISDIKNNSIKPGSITITFDDGYYNNVSNAFPLLKKYKIPATIFVVTGLLSQKELLWPEKLAITLFLSKKTFVSINNNDFPLSSARDKAAAYQNITRHFKQCDTGKIDDHVTAIREQLGITEADIINSPYYNDFRFMEWSDVHDLHESEYITIGSHTVNHKRLSKISIKDAEFELSDSKKALEKELGTIKYFAYPYGSPQNDYTELHSKLAYDYGYKAAVSASNGTIIHSSDLYNLPRNNIDAQDGIEGFQYKVHGGIAFQNNTNFIRLLKGLATGLTH